MDTITIVIAIIATVITTAVRYKRGISNYATRRRIIIDVLNGSVIYPFALLIFSVVNPTVFQIFGDIKAISRPSWNCGGHFRDRRVGPLLQPRKDYSSSG